MAAFLDRITDAQRKADALAVAAMMQAATKTEHIRRLTDLDTKVLKGLIARAVKTPARGHA